MPTYLDCNATSPLEPEVSDIIRFYNEKEFGNSGSRTHIYGTTAKQAIQEARKQVASVVEGVDTAGVVFTSGATESNNIAILGLLKWAKENGKKHIVTTAIEHKAVLEPVAHAQSLGFDVSVISTDESGIVSPDQVLEAVRPDTFLISVMHVNNETGIVQPIDQIAEGLAQNHCYLHVDAAQGYGKELQKLNHPRIDLISVSGHKIYGPKGIGALFMRRRKFKYPPLSPIIFGGGQERGLRPGTLPVPLIAGLGKAAELSLKHAADRTNKNQTFKEKLLRALSEFDYEINGDTDHALPHTLNISLEGLNSEAIILTLKDIVAISNGSACTSQSYEPSHVLTAMGLSKDRIQSAIRLSWCHMTIEPDWTQLQNSLRKLT